MENNNIIQEEVFAFPASAAQRRLWILAQFQGASEAYHIMGALRVKGNFRLDIFEKSVAFLVERHESLRTTFEKDGETVLQVVHPHIAYTIPVMKIAGGGEQALQQLVHREAHQAFDLEKGPLFRISIIQTADTTSLLCCMHHIISDGWSMGVFIREISAAYNSLLHDRYPTLPELDIQYSDYTLWQNDLLEKGAMQQQLNYWEARLKDAPALLELPLDLARPHMQNFKGNAFEQVWDTALSAGVYELCRRYHTTPFTVLLAAFKVLLYRCTHQQDIVIGTPVANRGRKELESIIGFFVNTIPLRTQLNPAHSFAALLEQLNQSLPEDFDHQQLSFEKLLERAPHRRSSSYHPVYQVMFSLEGFSNETVRWEGVETSPLPLVAFFSKFDLTLTIREGKEQFTAVWEYNTTLFEESTVWRMAVQLAHIVRQATGNPLLPLQKIALLDAAEKEKILVQWNQTQASWPAPYCLHEQFEQQAALTPDNIAVKDDKYTLTYEALNRYANRLAHYLLAAGVQPGQPVGVSMDRNADMLAVLLAIMKAGAAYVPLDPAFPAARRAYMMADAGISCVITQRHLLAGLQQEGVSLLAIDAIQEQLQHKPDSNPAPAAAPHDPVYIIYTSGSTGQPKGVRIPHNALMNFLHGIKQRIGIYENDRLLALTSLSFDIAGLELYLPFMAGATVVIAPREVTQNGSDIRRYLETFDITFMQATPAMWLMLLDAGWTGRPGLKALCGGEAFPRELANQLLAKAGEVWNMYGPTETTIWSSVYRIVPDNRATVPVGRPIANTDMYILDAQLQPVPAGVTGMLYIGGSGLAIDYYHKPELTAEKFIPHPFISGEKLYCTGDQARYLPNGNILFLGRADFQVKVNGYRIELEEIEYHLSKTEGVKQAVVSVKADGSGMNRLVAYVVPGSSKPSPDTLRSALLQKIPAYMVPSLFQFLEALPLTPNGKVNRQALPEPDISRERLQSLYEAPATPEEKILVQLWQEVLEIEKIGVHDNFFDLGGASLQSISVVNRVAAAGLKLTPELMFEFQTIRELAPRATAYTGPAGPVQQQESLFVSPDIFYRSAAMAPAVTERRHKNIIIESLGCYLPEKTVTSKEVLEGCVNVMRFPIEKLTGVKTRRMAAEDEFAFDLAVKAGEECFALSQYGPEDIDVLISCNIFRVDQPDRLTLEPSTAVRLARHFGCTSALTFDVSNACAGIFTALMLAESMIRTGQAARVMLVSGEYLTHVMRTQQPELKDYLDAGIATLTGGDSGVAMILEASEHPGKGFIDLDFFTMGAYSDLCVIKASTRRPGFHMWANAIRMMEAGHMETAKHAMRTLLKNRWTPEHIDFLVMHQASSIAITQTRKAINRFLNREAATPQNVIDNIQHRGNTATTTHWVAMHDHIMSGNIQGNKNMLLYISGSGLNIGTALYSFDDLPERITKYRATGTITPKRITTRAPQTGAGKPFRVKLAATGVAAATDHSSRSALSWATAAAQSCLQRAAVDKAQIGLVCFTGVHRDEHIFEPSIASMLSGNLDINSFNNQPEDSSRTVSFDIFNGSIGFLQACYAAVQVMQAGRCSYALISAGEMDNNAGVDGAPQLDISEGGAAWLLEAGTPNNSGFGCFLFRTATGFPAEIHSWVEWPEGTPVVRREPPPVNMQVLLPFIQQLVQELLIGEGLEAGSIDYIITPFAAEPQALQLAAALQLTAARPVHLPGPAKDMLSLTLPNLMEALRMEHSITGRKALLISAGAGGQIGATVYYC